MGDHAASGSKARDVVIGGGLIGVEATEALVESGCRVSIVEMLAQILSSLDWEMAKRVERHMESKGVEVLTQTQVQSFEGNGEVTGVVTARGSLPAAMGNITTAANVARNKLDGNMDGISTIEVHEKIGRGEEFVFLDVRSPAEQEQVRVMDGGVVIWPYETEG